jgi:3-oxoacyl-[acyl-carrier protein] reductase
MPDAPVMLITGTRKGIGAYLADHYVKKGFLVEGCSREAPAWNLPNYHHHIADVSNEAQVRPMFADIQQRHGRLDVVVNSAGAASMNHVLLTPAVTVDKILATNFKGTFLICREGAKMMKRQRQGRIVCLTSVAVPLSLEGEAVYAASKSAVETLVRIIARELGEYGITCNAIGPTPVETDLIRGVGREKIDRIVERLALKRLGRFEDIANVIDFFIKPESDYITGQIIYLGGVS